MPEQSPQTPVPAYVAAVQEPRQQNTLGLLPGHRVELFGHERADDRIAFAAAALCSRRCQSKVRSGYVELRTIK